MSGLDVGGRVVLVLVVMVHRARISRVLHIRQAPALACVHDGGQVTLELCEFIGMCEAGGLLVRRCRVEGAAAVGSDRSRQRVGLHVGGVARIHGDVRQVCGRAGSGGGR